MSTRNQPSGHPFTDTDGDGLCDFVTDFPAGEARCLAGAAEHADVAAALAGVSGIFARMRRQNVRIVCEPGHPSKLEPRYTGAIHVLLEDGSDLNFRALTVRVEPDAIVEAEIDVFPGAVDVVALATLHPICPHCARRLDERPTAAPNQRRENRDVAEALNAGEGSYKP